MAPAIISTKIILLLVVRYPQGTLATYQLPATAGSSIETTFVELSSPKHSATAFIRQLIEAIAYVQQIGNC